MAGFFSAIGAFFSQGAAGYATLLVFSLATITGSMYVLSTRQADDVIFATLKFENSALATNSPADFKPEAQVRTVIVNFEGGIATGLREAVTNLAGSIRAVSSNIIAEAQREDAARAAALAARPSAFGLSADSQLVAQAPPITVPNTPVPSVATTAPAAPTAPPPAATQVVVIPTTPPQPTAVAPTQPAVPTAVPPTPVPPTAVPATAVAPTATPVPPAATTAPQQPSQPEQPTAGPSQSTPAAEQPTSVAAAPTALPAVPTVPPATVVPLATLVPTPRPVATLPPLAFDLGFAVGYQPFFTISGGMSAGEPVSRDVVLLNSSGNPMVAYLGTSLIGPSDPAPVPTPTPLASTPLWTDPTNGLQAKITLTSGSGASQTTSVKYDGPLNFNNVLLTTLTEGQVHVMNVSVYLPVGIPNTLQATSQSASFAFTLIQ